MGTEPGHLTQGKARAFLYVSAGYCSDFDQISWQRQGVMSGIRSGTLLASCANERDQDTSVLISWVPQARIDTSALPIPEPQTYALLGMGLMMLGAHGRWRAARRQRGSEAVPC